MSTEGVDLKRRRFLTTATSVVGGVGAVFVAVPFVTSMLPSAKTQAAGAPVDVDINKLEPGQRIIVEWRGKPVWVLWRTQEAMDTLVSLRDQLRDPDSEQNQQPLYAKNELRSIKPEILVVIGICTHLGCSPTYRPDVAPADLGPDWKGGFFCPCHGGKYDMAGRVYKGLPPPLNLVVPPYRYLTESRIVIGEHHGQA